MPNRTRITALPLLPRLPALLPDHSKLGSKQPNQWPYSIMNTPFPLRPRQSCRSFKRRDFFSRNESGVTRKEVFLLVLVLSFLALMFLPPAHGPYRSSRLGCINNLKQIGLGFHIWASDNDSRFPMQVSVTNGGTMELSERGDVFPHFLVMSNELNTPKVLFCPADAQRQAAVTFSDGLANANISYFVGLDAQESLPQMWLAGDDCFSINGNPLPSGILSLPANAAVSWNQSRHRRLGNVALVDGSVLRISDTRELQYPFAQIPLATNRLVIP